MTDTSFRICTLSLNNLDIHFILNGYSLYFKVFDFDFVWLVFASKPVWQKNVDEAFSVFGVKDVDKLSVYLVPQMSRIIPNYVWPNDFWLKAFVTAFIIYNICKKEITVLQTSVV